MRSHTFRLPCLLLGALAGGCNGVPYDEPVGLAQYDAGPSGPPDGGIRPTRPVPTGEIAPVYGFVGPEAQVEYYYLGEVDRVSGQVPLNPIYFFYDEQDRPLFRLADDGSRLVGWHPVVDVIPTRGNYSPFWKVVKVKVKGSVDPATLDELRPVLKPQQTCQMDAVCGKKRCIEERCRDAISVGNYELDGIKSHETLQKSGLELKETGQVLNCPVVDAAAKLLKGLASPDLPFPKVQLWYKRLRAYCVLMEGSKELLGAGSAKLAGSGLPPVKDAYFINRELTFGTAEKSLVLPARNLVLTDALPGQPGYSPLVREWKVFVDKDHEFKDVRSVAEAKSKGLKLVATDKLHNLVVRGTLPACKGDEECAQTGGKVDPPLKCSIESGYCSPPPARLLEECRRGVKECDNKGGPGGTRLVCVGFQVRKKYFCQHTCDSSTTDGDPDPDIDTRCGAVKGFKCFPLRRTDPTRPNGVCIQTCNSRAGDKAVLLAQCVSPTCGNGKLEHGESCDDGNRKNGDGCNEFCSLSTFDRCDKSSDCKGSGQECKEPVFGQAATYCLPAATKEKNESEEAGKFRTICMEYDYCFPPDERADWLGKKEEGQP